MKHHIYCQHNPDQKSHKLTKNLKPSKRALEGRLYNHNRATSNFDQVVKSIRQDTVQQYCCPQKRLL